MGWQGRRNGKLLASMREAGYDALVTVDRNLQFQQNLPEAGIVVIVLRATTNRLADLRRHIPAVRDLLRTAEPGHVYRTGVYPRVAADTAGALINECALCLLGTASR